MDRFIGIEPNVCSNCEFDLKSNMDRFIANEFTESNFWGSDLKSNMDRFIVLFTIIKIITSSI